MIEIDPPLTAKVLRTANSAYYCSRRHISDIAEAVIWIGFEALKEISLNQTVCELFQKTTKIEDYSRLDLWKHSIATAIFGKMIYRKEFGESGENIYAAGLLHDIGIIVEDQFFRYEFKYALKRSKSDKVALEEAEKEMWGYDHSDIGRVISDSWQFPEDLVMSIGCHHRPFETPDQFSRMACILYIADYYCYENGFGYGSMFRQDKALFKGCLEKLGIEVFALDMIFEDLRREIKKMEEEGLF